MCKGLWGTESHPHTSGAQVSAANTNLGIGLSFSYSLEPRRGEENTEKVLRPPPLLRTAGLPAALQDADALTVQHPLCLGSWHSLHAEPIVSSHALSSSSTPTNLWTMPRAFATRTANPFLVHTCPRPHEGFSLMPGFRPPSPPICCHRKDGQHRGWPSPSPCRKEGCTHLQAFTETDPKESTHPCQTQEGHKSFHVGDAAPSLDQRGCLHLKPADAVRKLPPATLQLQ